MELLIVNTPYSIPVLCWIPKLDSCARRDSVVSSGGSCSRFRRGFCTVAISTSTELSHISYLMHYSEFTPTYFLTQSTEVSETVTHVISFK